MREPDCGPLWAAKAKSIATRCALSELQHDIAGAEAALRGMHARRRVLEAELAEAERRMRRATTRAAEAWLQQGRNLKAELAQAEERRRKTLPGEQAQPRLPAGDVATDGG